MAIWEKLFSKITFKNYPDTSTPINADNLNKMTDAIDGIDDRVVELNSNLIKNAKQLLFNSDKLKSTNVQDAIDEVANSMMYGEVKTGEMAKNAANAVMPEVSVYGKSTQAGEPTPDVPVDIVSVDKALVVKSVGKNLLENTATSQTIYGVTFSVKDGIITANGTSTNMFYLDINTNIDTTNLSGALFSVFTDNNAHDIGSYMCRISSGSDRVGIQDFTENNTPIIDNGNNLRLAIRINNGVTMNNVVFKPMIRPAGTDNTYEPYVSTQATIGLADDLRGIPVTTGGNYTDANGQQWICDTLEKYADGTGKLIKRVYKETINSLTASKLELVSSQSTGTTAYYNLISVLSNKSQELGTVKGYCNVFKVSNRIWSSLNEEAISGNLTYVAIRINKDRVTDYTNLNEVATYLNSLNIEFVYTLAEPIETDLTAEQVTALEQLQSFEPYTTVMTDDIGDVKCTYLINSSTARVLNSKLNDYDAYNIELIENEYYEFVTASKEYRKNGTTIATFGAVRCLQQATSWTHIATLKSNPSINIYAKLFSWYSGEYHINCKIETDGKVYFRHGTPNTDAGAIDYYITISFS